MYADISAQAKVAIAAAETLFLMVEAEPQAFNREDMRRARQARSNAELVLKSVRRAQLARVLEPGDRVALKHRGHGTFKGWICQDRHKALVEREGYGVGWWDVDELELVCIDELGRTVAYLEKHVAEWADRPGRDKSAPDRLAGYQRQLAKLRTAELTSGQGEA